MLYNKEHREFRFKSQVERCGSSGSPSTLASITPERWKKSVHHVVNVVEADYRQRDGLCTPDIEPFIIYLNSESDSEESDNEDEDGD